MWRSLVGPARIPAPYRFLRGPASVVCESCSQRALGVEIAEFLEQTLFSGIPANGKVNQKESNGKLDTARGLKLAPCNQ